jgi:DNA-directed RNA polymerase specialized sigma subunit
MSREKDILLLTECIAGLPSLERKVLALYYLENISLVDIAAGLGLSEAQTCQILVGSIDLVQRRFRRSRRTPSLRNRQKIIPSQGGDSTGR